jgi:3-phosphoinositide dependent protein kinase-1
VEYCQISREPSRSSLSGPPGGPRPSQRDRSNTDRTYRQSQAAGSSPIHGDCDAAGGWTGSPYALENGLPASSEEWQEKGAAVGFTKEKDANGNTVIRTVKKGVKDFNFGRTLGEGSYSSVRLHVDKFIHH